MSILNRNLIGVTLLALACSESPLLNHQNANAAQKDSATTSRPASGKTTSAPSTPRTDETKKTEEKAKANDPCDLEFKEANRCGFLEWEEAPKNLKVTSCIIRFWNRDSDREEKRVLSSPPGTLSVFPWMGSMGHGSTLKTVIEELQPGEYRVKNIKFIMPGEWQMIVKFMNKEEVIDESKLDLTIEE